MQHRQDIIREIGLLKPSINTYTEEDSVNFSSIFSIPVPHRVHDINKTKEIEKFFVNVEKNWEITNNVIEEMLWLTDIKQYIKDAIFEDVDPTDTKSQKTVIYENKNLYLSHKNKNIELTFDGLKLILTEIDLWILDGNIAFFTYKIELNKEHTYDINTLSTKINRSLRDFQELSIDVETMELFYRAERPKLGLLDYFMSLTIHEEETSFLNLPYAMGKMVKDEKKSKKEKKDVERWEKGTFVLEEKYQDLSVIHSSTYYAKTITALHIDQDHVNAKGEEVEIAPITPSLAEPVTIDINVLEELSYLLATTSSFDFDKERSFVAYEGYAYGLIKDRGINIWKYWSGIALQDTVSFFSIKDGGGGIVAAAKTSNYFIYIINLYVNIRLKYIENYLIDRDFINIERVLPSVKEIQILKNHFIANEIAVKFQPNEINDKIYLGLKNDELLEEVESNLQVTLELTRNNTDILFSIITGIATVIGLSFNKEAIFDVYTEHPIFSSLITAVLIIFIMYVASKKSVIIRFGKNIFKKSKRILNLSVLGFEG